MHESQNDLRRLQSLLDASYQAAGAHHAEIHSDRVRLTAAELAEALPWMQVLVVATVSSDGRPFVGPVDAFLLRGRIYFGTSPQALRARHLLRNPAVSATFVHGEELVVTAHGRALPVDLDADTALVDHLITHYGQQWWQEWGRSGAYFVIEPDRLFAADMRRHQHVA